MDNKEDKFSHQSWYSTKLENVIIIDWFDGAKDFII